MGKAKLLKLRGIRLVDYGEIFCLPWVLEKFEIAQACHSSRSDPYNLSADPIGPVR